MPTLVIHGENDPVQSKEATSVYSDAIPTAKLVSLQGSHFIFNDNPKEFEKSVNSFISQLKQ